MNDKQHTLAPDKREIAPDKREMATVFRDRLRQLIARRNDTASAFAVRMGIDRSAMSQFLDPASTRMPRAEALAAIAWAQGVSVDWLLGLSQHETALGEIASLSGVEMATDDVENSLLAEWRRDAIGYKIRYVPNSIPDLLRTRAVTEHEFGKSSRELVDTKKGQSQSQLDYSRRPESDMEVVMPFQRLEQLAKGEGRWSSLARGARKAQLELMATLLDELYPTLRLYLYDEKDQYSAPFTVFGTKRAAIYLGDMYLVINSVNLIKDLTIRFDQIIRHATITADSAPDYISKLLK